MFSGKTSRLIADVTTAYITNPNSTPLVINHISDVRYSNTMLSSHDRTEIPCIFLENLMSTITTKATHIFINEAQFFPDLYEFVVELLRRNKKIFVYGLDGDYKQQPIGDILRLIPLADSYTKLTAICEDCGGAAIFSHRIVEDDTQILVGQKESYIPLCRGCAAAAHPPRNI
jgi:thymidine kinase